MKCTLKICYIYYTIKKKDCTAYYTVITKELSSKTSEFITI